MAEERLGDAEQRDGQRTADTNLPIATLTLDRLRDRFAVCRLEPESAIPDWANRRDPAEFVSVTRSKDELSIICRADLPPADVPQEGPWRGFRVRGPLDFQLIGILSELCGQLARRRIPVFAISTFDTDYLLVAESDADAAATTLQTRGHKIAGPPWNT